MKLYRSILERMIELPSSDVRELRNLLDELGLEVKDVEQLANEVVFNIETLANRGDHLHALGIARELSARLLTSLKVPAVAADLPENKNTLPVRVSTDKCLRYALMDLSLPEQFLLRPEIAAVMGAAAQDKPVIVNYLNYVQLEIGQPMHAFDRDKVDGEVRVTLSSREQELHALDGKTYKVPAESILIEDRSKVIAVAGVIGLANSMVSGATKRVLIEAATFDAVSVRKTARAMGISTDASYAFERGQDVENVIFALRRLLYLTQGAGGAVKEANGSHALGLSSFQGDLAGKRKVSFKISDIRREINLPRLEELEIISRLKHLGYQLELVNQSLKGSDKEYAALVPSWRMWDVEDRQDLVEDFARSLGLNRVKQMLPSLDYDQPSENPIEVLSSKIETVLLGQGFNEVITKGFYSAEDARLLGEFEPAWSAQHVTIKNAIERSYSHMKVSNVLHLARLAVQNQRRGVESFKVFELGRVFNLAHSKESTYEFERDVLSLAVSGRWSEHDYKKAASAEVLLSLLKGVLEQILGRFGVQLQIVESKHGILHSGCQAALKVGRTEIGFFGLLHPELKRRLDLRNDLAYAEIDADLLNKIKAEVSFKLPNDLPSVTRDITLKLPVRGLASKVIKQVGDFNCALLESMCITDSFRKKEEDFRRVTYRLTFRETQRTLQHEEVDGALQKILDDLKQKHGLELA